MSAPPTSSRGPTRLVAACLLVVLAVAAGAPGLRADTRKDLERAQKQQERLEHKIEQRETVATRIRESMNALAEKVEIAMNELEEARHETEIARARLGRVQARLEVLHDRLNARIADTFMYSFHDEIAYLLGAQSVEDVGDRILFVGAVADADIRIAEEIDEKRQELAEIEADLADLLERRKAIVERLREHRAKLDRQFAKQRKHLRRLAKLHGKVAHDVAELTAKIRAELLARGGDGILGPLYVCPVDGPTAYGDTFGMVHHHKNWTHKHQGNDMMAALGTPVVAPFDGYATNGSQTNAGIYVKVTGAEGFVYMMHLQRLGKLGAVEEGDVVGYVGTTGNASSPHVHFEWHPGNGAAVDPYPQLNEVC
jgi:murein DD-endopeptidase MepM/ murein hydrolase activator NlpD